MIIVDDHRYAWINIELASKEIVKNSLVITSIEVSIESRISNIEYTQSSRVVLLNGVLKILHLPICVVTWKALSPDQSNTLGLKPLPIKSTIFPYWNIIIIKNHYNKYINEHENENKNEQSSLSYHQEMPSVNPYCVEYGYEELQYIAKAESNKGAQALCTQPYGRNLLLKPK